MDTMILIAQAASLAFLALWLSSGVYDNLRFPRLNEEYTADVLDMARMRADYPDAYAMVAHRRMSHRGLQVLAFRLVVIWELLAVLVMWAGVAAMAGAAGGLVAANSAGALAIAGALMFTATWAGFLIVGNYFCYYFGHEGAQNTHYQMTLWGLATMILIAVG